MTNNKVLTPLAFVAALALASAPAFAQEHRGGGRAQGRSYSGGQGRSYSGSGYRGGGERVAPRVYSPRGYYARPYYGQPYYARPYYSFRPHVSLGFGLWLGYPVSYPYYYARPYAYPYADPYAYDAVPYGSPSYGNPSYGAPSYGPPSGAPSYGSPAYGPPPSSSVVPQGGDRYDRGGISFEITPQDAGIYVDGKYVGTAGEFGPDARPLDLSTGRHRVDVRAQGYRSMSFDAEVRAGQVLPYQGTLQRD